MSIIRNTDFRFFIIIPMLTKLLGYKFDNDQPRRCEGTQTLQGTSDLKDFQKNFRLQLRSDQPQPSSQKQSNNLQLPPSKNKGNQSKSRKRRPFLIRKFEDVYTLTDQLLGRGANSSVVVCYHRNTNKHCAVKVIPQSDDEDIRKRVLREIEILYIGRSHNHILHLIEYFEQQNKFYLVFNKMEGGPLFQRIKRQKNFTEQEACAVLRDVASAISFLHRKNIAHRDLKPENILCEKVDEVSPVRICDFDLSHISQQRTPNTPTLMTPVGSAEYMAPEVVQAYTGDSFTYDKKCDLWSLGVVLYMMLSGRVPFEGNCGENCGWEQGKHCDQCQSLLLGKIQAGNYNFSGKEWRDISDPAKDLITHMLECNPDRRYSAQQVLEHVWITQEAPPTPLTTPTVLSRNNSFPQNLSQFAAVANSLTRQLSSSHSRNPSLEIMKPLLLPEEDDERVLSLSPPAMSELAVRRQANIPDHLS